MKQIDINLSSNYKIIIDKNIDVEKYIKQVCDSNNVFIVVDEIVYDIYQDKIINDFKNFSVTLVTMKSKEDNKTLKTYESITSQLLDSNITRDSLLISIGGGIVGDVTSFIASTLLRGIKYVAIPTTLLSQVDSSIGGKTGINFNNKKNILGTFFQPSLVLIDTNYLSTLKTDEYNNGLGEIIKCGMIYDFKIISLLRDKSSVEDVIYKSLLTKKYFVEKDEFDNADRMILNFGHTFGHVIELEHNIKHGLAIIDGMIMMIKYGIDNNITNSSVLTTITSILEELEIKYNNYNYNEYLSKLSYDKKNTVDGNTFILLTDVNKPIIKKIKKG